MTPAVDRVMADWRALGVAMPGRAASGAAIDLERLLLDTARVLPSFSRMHVVASTWLHLHADVVAKHRLRRLVADELEESARPVLGLLLDTAQVGTHPRPFDVILDRLPPAATPSPLFVEAADDPAIAAYVRRRSSPIARRWRRWAQPVEFKFDAIRPAEWIRANWPDFVPRADWRGDLRASVMASLRFDAGAGDSELRLAQCAGGSRAQVRNALRSLRMTGRIRMRKADGANRTEIRLVSAPESTPGRRSSAADGTAG